ncbi:MAG: site-specific DNA-methyltransferase [Candidatus Riflebacteria bacterium]|nr:site-specific DNA-methyltransferase [Candidatus Riflebacteria bacterium]
MAAQILPFSPPKSRNSGLPRKITQPSSQEFNSNAIPRIFDEFWTAKQRQMHSLHYAVSYRGSFKPELPDFFIKKFSDPGDIVGDPFGGRGTTALQSVLLGRRALSNDANPLSERLTYPKLNPITEEELEGRLNEINFERPRKLANEEDLSMFYHPDTYREILNLKDYLKENRDDVDRFIELIAISRLHGHSAGFFSAYSFPQISIPKSNQAKINKTRGVEPDYRDIKSRILKKGRLVLKDGEFEMMRKAAKKSLLTTSDSRDMSKWKSGSVDLIVTSPPFLNQVDYIADGWLETWFCGIEKTTLNGKIVQTPSLDEWMQFISDTLTELHRVVKSGGVVAMEVGEVRYQSKLLNLDEVLVKLISEKKYNAGQFSIREIYVQSQEFTKLANCFNVKNNVLGTNTNRIVLMERK